MQKRLTLLALAIMLVPDGAMASPLALEDLVRRALAGHPTALAASASVAAREAAVGIAEAPRLPQVSLSSGFSGTTQVSNTVTGDPSAVGTYQLSARQSLYDFGRTDSAIAEASAGADLARQEARRDAVDIAYGVRRAYLGWLRDRSLADLAGTKVASARRVRDQADAFYRAGKRSRIDLTRAEAALLLAQAEASRARASAASSGLALEAAVGEPGLAGGDPALPAEPLAARLAPAELLAVARDRHPGLAGAAARLRRSEAARAGAEHAVWPDLRADGSYGLRTRDLIPKPNWSVGVTFSAPLFDGFATPRGQDEAMANERAAREAVRGQEIEVDVAVRKALIAAQAARDRLPAAEAAVRSAADNLELAEGRYGAGVGSVIEVGDAQALLAAAEADRTRDRSDYHLALADLLRATGMTGLESDGK